MQHPHISGCVDVKVSSMAYTGMGHCVCHINTLCAARSKIEYHVCMFNAVYAEILQCQQGIPALWIHCFQAAVKLSLVGSGTVATLTL
jgi:hypothetical protein